MKTLLFAALLALPAAASAAPEALDQLKDCAEGRCWDSKGQPVTVVPQGAVLIREPVRTRPLWDKRPPEPPRFTVMSKEEVDAAQKRQAVLGPVMGAGAGAVLGLLVAGVPGAVVGGLIGLGIMHLLTRPRG